MATLVEANNKPVAIKNLSWLLRNWKRVESLGFNYAPDNQTMNDGQLVAKLYGGGIYFCDFASLSVCWNWLNRPVFKGCKFVLVQFFDKRAEFVVGDDKWKEINKLKYLAFQQFLKTLFP